MVSFESKTYSKRLLHLISWSHWFTFFNIGIAILLSSLYLIGEPLPESFIGTAYLLTTWFSHMAFLTFFTFVLIVFPLTLLFPNTKFIRTSASLIFTLGLLLLVLDAFIYYRLGYHLNASSRQQIFALIASQIQDNSIKFWLSSSLLCVLILGFEFTVSNYAWKHLKQLQKTFFARKIVIPIVVAFFFSHITHIWADAKLDYDVLQQDTILPLSYPLTAKTLLTKYDLFDRKDYLERLSSPLIFTKKIPSYPSLSTQCQNNQAVTQSAFIILTAQMISKQQINNFIQRSPSKSIRLSHHIDNALGSNAWFNLLYSLPSIYQQGVLAQKTQPLLFQALNQKGLTNSFTQINRNDVNDEVPALIADVFSQQYLLKNTSSLLLANTLNSYPAGLHIFYFRDQNSFQFELFMDGLLLAQKQKKLADIIWISSLGNADKSTSLKIKPALLLWPEQTIALLNLPNKKVTKMSYLTSQMDIMPTLLKNWLGCDLSTTNYSVGRDILALKTARVIANTIENGLMVFNKDKSVFIDQNGNFQSYSLQLQAPIIENPDFPLMIDGVRFIKQFSQLNEKKLTLSRTNEQ